MAELNKDRKDPALIKAMISRKTVFKTAPESDDPVLEAFFKHVLHIEVANVPLFKCYIHGEVEGWFEIYGKEICGKCAANAIEKFIKDMNKNNSTKGS